MPTPRSQPQVNKSSRGLRTIILLTVLSWVVAFAAYILFFMHPIGGITTEELVQITGEKGGGIRSKQVHEGLEEFAEFGGYEIINETKLSKLMISGSSSGPFVMGSVLQKSDPKISDNVYTGSDYTQANRNELGPFFLASDIPQIVLEKPETLIQEMLSYVNIEDVEDYSISVTPTRELFGIEEAIHAPAVELRGFVSTKRETHSFVFDATNGKIVEVNGEKLND